MASKHRSDMPGPDVAGRENPKARAAAEREARLKQALRENLKRRKGQSRSRPDGDAAGDEQEH